MPYFDHNATTPLAPVARETWLRLADEAWHNPSSPTRDGARARLRLDAARERIAEFLGAPPARLVFNCGATEGANAVFAHWARQLPSSARIALNPTEHPAVLEAARRWLPDRLVMLDLTADGVVRVDALANLLSLPPTDANAPIGAVVVMAANNETGVLQPWREITRLCARHHTGYLCDATQWLGKLPGSGLGAAGWIIASAHKFGGPKGTGLLVLPEQSESFCAQAGGHQENGHRGGTEDVPSICAAAAALAEAEQSKVFLEDLRLRWRDDFVRCMLTALPGSQLISPGAERLWNTVSLMLPRIENTRCVTKLDKRGFQVSTGSACAAGTDGPSHVLAALGLPADDARRVIRISSGWETTEADWRALLDAILAVAAELIPPETPVAR
jgi:cysteine desulfurase